MEIRICPECNRAFYTPCKKDYIVCSLCGHTLHESRAHKRVKCSIDFTFTKGEEQRAAILKDYSKDGSRIKYKGAALPDDMILKIDIDELNFHRLGRPVWTKIAADSVKVTGLRLL